MKFFVPDWDDRVDPGYDFLTDRFTLKRDPYADDQYAHEVLGDNAYDGILVSRMALGEAGPKRALVERIGMRRFLRLPSHLKLIGDCGAFGYIRSQEPPFESEELVSYYARLGFDLGVSVDHAIVPEFHEQRRHRYGLTLRNAETFLTEHKRVGAAFIPIGTIQGWDHASYIDAAISLVGMGYEYLALGGLARSRTKDVLSVATVVMAAIPPGTRVHVFGIARVPLLASFIQIGIESVDSASPIRQAWLSATDNYYGERRTYAALRVPIADQERVVCDSLVARSDRRLGELRAAEREALNAVREYDARRLGLRSTLAALMAYDALLAKRRDAQSSKVRHDLYRQTLADRPWTRCRCPICAALGVEVILFRGNNRNRRRGFHNLFVTQQRLRQLRGPALD
jgi:hypothetical protein